MSQETLTRAVQIDEFGGPEVLQVVEVPRPQPGADEVLIQVTRAGINYADTHTRTNSYLAPARLPLILGVEVAGIRTDTGERVIALVGSGGYAEYAVAPKAMTFPLPDGVDEAVGLALLAQGLCAWHILHTCARVEKGESVVVHAAAGGVGSLAVQLARVAGAGSIIATASTEPKRDLALQLGAGAAIDASPEGMAERLIEANGGRRIDVVLEMTGGPVLDQSLAAMAPFGRLVVYGAASGQRNSVSTGALMARSLSVIGFWLVDCLRRPGMISTPLSRLFDLVQRGELQPLVGGTYPLAEAGRAHADLEARRTTGKLVLDVTA